MAFSSGTSSFTVEAEILFQTTPVIEYLKKENKEVDLKSYFKYLNPEYLDSFNRVSNQIYNILLNEALSRFNKYKSDSEYKNLAEEYKALLKKKENTKKVADKIQIVKDYYGYSEFALQHFAIDVKNYFKDKSFGKREFSKLGIDECQKLASRAFNTVEKIRKGKAKKVRFHHREDDTSFEGKSKNSMVKYKDGFIVIHSHLFPVDIKDNYIKDSLETRKIKYIRIVRKTIRGRKRYFAQFVMEGVPVKLPKYGKGRVGLDEGVSVFAVVSKKHVRLEELASSIDDILREIRRIDRAMDRSKRATNPQNYNKDGTLKKGHLKWDFSNRYKRLRAKRKELYRRMAILRRESNNRLANMIVSLGTDIYVEDMNLQALQKKAKNITYRKDGRINSKRRYGKTIMIRAPGQVIQALERKLSYIGKKLNKLNTFETKASQYDHKSDIYKKKPLHERWHYFEDGTKVQRDIYSAFLLYNNMERRKCQRNYKKFKELHDEAIKEVNSNLRWYVR